MRIFSLVFFLSLNILPFSQFDVETTLSQRAYQEDQNPITNTYNTSLGLKLSGKAKSEEDNYRVKVVIDSLYDFMDEDRFYVYPEEAWIGYDDGSHILKVGFQHFNWSSTEAFRPSDVVNSRNLDTQIKNASKIGEPMISYKKIIGQASLTTFVSPFFMKPLYPGLKSSYATPSLPVDSYLIFQGDSRTDKDPSSFQGGVIFNFSISKSDIALHYINHIDRDSFIPLIDPVKRIITPIYYRKQQVGLTSQNVIGGMILKTEFVSRFFTQDVINFSQNNLKNYHVGTIGIEKNFPIGDGELIFLTEYIKAFSQNSFQANSEVFDNDLLVGFRHSFNNVNGSELNLSLISDMKEYNQFIFNFSYSQRLKNNWKVEFGVNYVDSEVTPTYTGAEILDSADFAYLNIKKFL